MQAYGLNQQVLVDSCQICQIEICMCVCLCTDDCATCTADIAIELKISDYESVNASS